MIIDAHQHFWTLSRGDYGWLIPSMAALYRDFEPRDLEPELLARGITGTVLVQAAPTEAETHYLLELASHWPTARAVVGWTDLASGRAAHALEKLAAHPRLRGIRPMLQDEPDAEWLEQRSVGRSLSIMCSLGLTFDALVRPHQLGAIRRMVDRHPGLTVIIDHAGKPDIARDRYQPWAADIATLSERPRVLCKLSGLVTEAGEPASDAVLRPYVEHLLERFGPKRLLWGSDWPVLTSVGEYGTWFGQTERLIESLSPDEKTQIFYRTAASAYRVEESL